MNAKISSKLRATLLASTLGVAGTAFADTMIVTDHNANASPKHDAMLHCFQAVRSDVGDGYGLFFSNQVVTERSADGRQAIVVNGTVWQNGDRVPIQGRCEKSASGQFVAHVTRVENGTAIAGAK